jgi:hypothetical protein
MSKIGLAALVALVVAAAPAFGAGSGAFVGTTGDKHPISFKVSGQQVRSIAFSTRFTCTNHTAFVAKATYRTVKLRGARFSAAFAAHKRALRTTIKGSIRGGKASGTIKREARFNRARKLDRKGRLVCTSQTTWSAVRR